MPTTETFTSVVNSYLPEPQASLLNGILFGIPLSKASLFYQQLQMLGLLHIVVLSGMNITILAALVSVFTISFGKQASLLITILSVMFFIIFVGPQAPIIRAGFTSILTFVSIIYGRRTFALYSLLLSAVFIAFVWPAWIKSISFQLSYAATLGIILFARTESLNQGLRLGSTEGNQDKLDYQPPSRLTKITKFIIDDLRITLSAQLFTAPLIFIYFKQFSSISPLSNLLVSFIIPPLMIFGFATALLGKIHFLLGLLPAYICYGLLTYIVFVVNQLSKLPFIFFQF